MTASSSCQAVCVHMDVALWRGPMGGGGGGGGVWVEKWLLLLIFQDYRPYSFEGWTKDVC